MKTNARSGARSHRRLGEGLGGTRWWRWLRVAAALAVLCVCAGARGTTLERMTIESMTRKASVVVRGRCVANTVAWDRGEIWTVTTFAVEETWKGAPAGAAREADAAQGATPSGSLPEIRVRLLGGRVGNLTSTVAAVPRFRAGEDVVLFLEPAPHENFSVTSWAQGTFRVRRDARTGETRATQDTANTETFDATTRKFAATGERDVSLTALRARVRAAANTGGDGR